MEPTGRAHEFNVDESMGARSDDCDVTDPQAKITRFLPMLTTAAILSGLAYGYDNGMMSGSMVYIRTEMSLNDVWQQVIVSATLATAAVSAFCGGFLSTAFGRKPVILVSCAIFVAGSIIQAFAATKRTLLLGRIVLGLGIGPSSGIVSPYIAECSPKNVRGRLLVYCELAKTAGLFAASVASSLLSYIDDANLNWRIMLGLSALPALIQIFAFSFMPESPRWLTLNAKEDEARRALLRIYAGDACASKQANSEIKAIREAQQKYEKEKEEAGARGQSVIVAIFQSPPLRKALVIGCTLQMAQKLSGATAMNYYSAAIIIMSGIQEKRLALWLTTAITGLKILVALVGVYFVDKIGRRSLLLRSVLGVFVMLILTGVAFALIAAQSPASAIIEAGATTDLYCQKLGCDECSYNAKCGFCFQRDMAAVTGACVPIGRTSERAAYGRCAFNESSYSVVQPDAVWNYGYCPTTLSWLLVTCMLLHSCAYNPGFAPLPWVITAEIFPNWARGCGSAVVTTVSYLSNLFVSLTFLTMARTMTRQGVFFFYAGCTLVGLAWFYLVVPETKNKSMENVQDLLNGQWFSGGRPVQEERANETAEKAKLFQTDVERVYGSSDKGKAGLKTRQS